MASYIFILSIFVIAAGISGYEVDSIQIPTGFDAETIKDLLAYDNEIDEKCEGSLWTIEDGRHILNKPCLRQIIREPQNIQLFLENDSLNAESYLLQPAKELLKIIMMLFSPRNDRSLVSGLTCATCKLTVATYKSIPQNKFTKNALLKLIKRSCMTIGLSADVCTGTVDIYGETVMNILDASKYPPSYICSLLLNQNCGEIPPEAKWEVSIPKNKPPVEKPSSPPGTVKPLKVLHIADTHWDTKYTVGSWSECNQPICCRAENVPPSSTASRAGKFGGWRCDTPEATFDSMLQHVNRRHPDIDYIVWTGDIPAHDLWEQTVAKNLDIIKKTVAKIFVAFPNTPMFPAIGNHESVPPNLFPRPNEKGENPMDWLFEVVNEQWGRWLPSNVSKTVRKGAFYTTVVRPGLRVVSMNTNYCYRMNWWLVENDQDPLDELKWFTEILQEAEKNNEKVHVVGHIPPGSDECLRQWQYNYYKIINRFEGTVTSQFFGHTHSDEFEVFYDMLNTNRSVGVGYIAPSLTTYMNHNPAYRIYYVEGDHKKSKRFVLDHETWYLDLQESNQLNAAQWKKLYTAKGAYNMTSLYPEDWDRVYQKIKTSDEVLQLYHKYYWNDSPKRPAYCDKNCRKQKLCNIKSCEQYGDPDF